MFIDNLHYMTVVLNQKINNSFILSCKQKFYKTYEFKFCGGGSSVG